MSHPYDRSMTARRKMWSSGADVFAGWRNVGARVAEPDRARWDARNDHVAVRMTPRLATVFTSLRPSWRFWSRSAGTSFSA